MGVYRRKDSRTPWWISYTYRGRQIREPAGPTKRIAEDALAARKADIARERFDLHDSKPSPLFRDFAEVYLGYARDNKKSWDRDVQSLKHLLLFFGNRRLNQISSFLIEHYKSERKTKVKPATVNRELSLLKHMLNLAIRWGKAGTNPARDVRPFKEERGPIRVLSSDECERLIEACPDYFRPIVIVALYTGMRKGEILGLRWTMVDFERGLVHVEKSKSGKTRSVPMHERLVEMFKGLKRNGEFVFSIDGKKPRKDIRKPFEKAQAEAGIYPRCRFHDLRHTFGSHLRRNGVDLVTVKELMGHSRIETTMKYMHSFPKQKDEAIATLNYHSFITEGESGRSGSSRKSL